jgi:hypothetical protein
VIILALGSNPVANSGEPNSQESYLLFVISFKSNASSFSPEARMHSRLPIADSRFNSGRCDCSKTKNPRQTANPWLDSSHCVGLLPDVAPVRRSLRLRRAFANWSANSEATPFRPAHRSRAKLYRLSAIGYRLFIRASGENEHDQPTRILRDASPSSWTRARISSRSRSPSVKSWRVA